MDSRQVKKVIYIAGKTSAGKTTLANKLSAKLGIPLYPADNIYGQIGKELKESNPSMLVLKKRWSKIKGIYNRKVKGYKELLKDSSDYFIIEGFPLGFKQDREIIDKVLGKHQKIFFYLSPLYEQWIKQTTVKYNKQPIVDTYREWDSYFEPPEHYYLIRNSDLLFMNKSEYQRKGFTDRKWAKLKLKPKDLKGTIVDVGCNQGWIGEYCLRNGSTKIIGLDYNWQDLTEAENKGVDTILCNFKEELPKVKGDTVLCLAVLQHIKDQERFIGWLSTIAPKLVLEIPVNKSDKESIEVRYQTTYIPSTALLERWLSKYYDFKIEGESIPPDNSYRLIYKCQRKEKEE